MKNFRPDKKLKRKRAWKSWRKTKNILDNWIKQQDNRLKAGLSFQKPPVQFPARKKYPKELTPTIKLEKKPEIVLKLKWYQKLWLKIQHLLKKIKK